MRRAGKGFALGFGLVLGALTGVIAVGAAVAAAHDVAARYFERKETE